MQTGTRSLDGIEGLGAQPRLQHFPAGMFKVVPGAAGQVNAPSIDDALLLTALAEVWPVQDCSIGDVKKHIHRLGCEQFSALRTLIVCVFHAV